MSNGDAQGNCRKRTNGKSFFLFRQGDSTKSEQHLVLLREEYVKLQQRHKILEKNHQILTSTSKINQDSFVYRLLKTVADLFNRELYR